MTRCSSEITDAGETGRFLQVNDVACRRLGYTRDELLALTPRDITPPGEFRRAARERQMLIDNGAALFETVHVSKDGRHIPVESNVHVIKYLGRRAAMSISRDITARRLAEEERLEMERRVLLPPFTFRQMAVSSIEFQALPGPEARPLGAKTITQESFLGPGGQAVLCERVG